MSKTSSDHVKAHIEVAIERAREGVSDRIDEIDRRLRGSLDMQQMASDHAPQLVAAGLAVGFLIGFGVPKVLTRAVQLGVPIFLAVQMVRKHRASSPA
jgi:ElaB/YqjD/DUF883 family membrane-anchored ribosome-binding protein